MDLDGFGDVVMSVGVGFMLYVVFLLTWILAKSRD